MRSIITGLTLFLSFFLVSCQKEIKFDDGSNGDLLIRALQVTPATNDTNTITFDWDAARRLLDYKATGKVNGTVTDMHHRILRNFDGTIKKIISKSAVTAPFIDSTVYTVHYESGTRLSYVIDTQYTILGPIRDSVAYSYNPSGYVASKEMHTDILGTLIAIARETYGYDTKGNLTDRKIFTPDGLGGFNLATQTTYTYDTRKNSITLAEECYIVIGPDNISKSFPNSSVTDDLIGSTSYTTIFSQTVYNEYDRPSKSSLALTPKPPGYDLKLLFYYR